MLIQILGSAAGGGVPQWNCGCRQCDAARSGFMETRTQCSVAISADERRWVLLNASPDLRSQLSHFKCQPPSQTRRSPIEAVLLSDADLDHTLGLFLLRENKSPISIHASLAIRKALEEGLRITDVLDRYCGIRWVIAPADVVVAMAVPPILCACICVGVVLRSRRLERWQYVILLVVVLLMVSVLLKEVSGGTGLLAGLQNFANSGAYFPLALITGILFPKPQEVKQFLKFCLIIYFPVALYAIW
jgi:hypothetical protein